MMVQYVKNINNILSKYLIQCFSRKEKLNILEAGCGVYFSLNLGGLEYSLTGIDIDEQALEIRKNVKQDLDIAILGDLRTIELKENNYHLIYCSFVLEHIEGAEDVMNNFTKWLKQNGIIILKIPDSDSVFGFITKATPFWMHVFYKRWIQGKPNAGKAGYAPFRTYYDKVISRKGIQRYCTKHNLEIVQEYGSHPRFRSNFFRLWYTLFCKIFHTISFGRLTAAHSSLTYIIKKP